MTRGEVRTNDFRSTRVFSEDDEFGEFSKLLAWYYMAEGVMNEHVLFVASLDYGSDHLVSNTFSEFA